VSLTEISTLTAEFVKLNHKKTLEPLSEADERRWKELKALLIAAQKESEPLAKKS